MKKAMNWFKRSFEKAKRVLVGVTATLSMTSVLALPASAATINDKADLNTVVGGILDVVFDIAFYLGIVIAIIGVISFILAYKDDNAEQQSRGIRLAIIGACLVGIEVLIKGTGLIK